ncbi:MAG TPA: hypothetical protein IAA76_06750 [Candidatus Ornithospirochaeta stercorigallinarum]|nr:hypothetical protein [Candidatus Ornithospirochaeta stercorigallinarum]
MRYYPSSLLESASWYSFNDTYVEKSKWYLPRQSDPSILLPSESPDGRWHLFCHTWLGIHHFVSTSGLNWKNDGPLVFFRGHSPFIYREGKLYYMVFERHDFKQSGKDVTKNTSSIFLSSSEDLVKWTDPVIILDSNKISLSSYRMGPCRLSRPQLVSWKGRYILYFGAGECRMFDTGQKTAVRFMYSESDFIDGSYKVRSKPALEVDPDGEYRNLAVGAVRIYPCADAICAVECAYCYDKEKNRSRSMMLLLKSGDGITFETIRVMHTQSEEGFASRAITSADLKYMENENTWYCYYSANNKERYYPFVRESLGLLLGRSGVI